VDQATTDRLRAELDADRTQHLDQLAEYGADPYSDDVATLDIDTDSFADSAQATEERSEILGHLETARQRVQAVDEALTRMEAGTYGSCVDCDVAIPAERLEARPLSVRCVACAEAGR
jgi:RNA polymerase-binding transcription factor DksA